jgi:hypothetical protein
MRFGDGGWLEVAGAGRCIRTCCARSTSIPNAGRGSRSAWARPARDAALWRRRPAPLLRERPAVPAAVRMSGTAEAQS